VDNLPGETRYPFVRLVVTRMGDILVGRRFLFLFYLKVDVVIAIPTGLVKPSPFCSVMVILYDLRPSCFDQTPGPSGVMRFLLLFSFNFSFYWSVFSARKFSRSATTRTPYVLLCKGVSLNFPLRSVGSASTPPIPKTHRPAGVPLRPWIFVFFFFMGVSFSSFRAFFHLFFDLMWPFV